MDCPNRLSRLYRVQRKKTSRSFHAFTRFTKSEKESSISPEFSNSSRDNQEYLLLTDATVQFDSRAALHLLPCESIISVTWQPRTLETTSISSNAPSGDNEISMDTTETVSCPTSHYLLAVLTTCRVLVVA